jgi:Zn ribbon nucleic-acid-binding protein
MTEEVRVDLNGISHAVLCSKCLEKIEFIGKPDPEVGLAECTACGYIDDVREIARQTVQYVRYEAELMIKLLKATRILEGTPMSFFGEEPQQKNSKYIVHLKI